MNVIKPHADNCRCWRCTRPLEDVEGDLKIIKWAIIIGSTAIATEILTLNGYLPWIPRLWAMVVYR